MARHRRHLFFSFGLGGLLVFLLASFRVAVVRGDSMLPTYHNGQMVLVNRLTLGRKWRRGDVVLIRAGEQVLIKRIALLPGDRLTLTQAAQFEDVHQFFDLTGDAETPLSVPAGHVVVLGDNRNVSDDSRSFGPLPLRDVLGLVLNAPPGR